MKNVTLGQIAKLRYGKLPPKQRHDTGYPIFTGYRVSGYASSYLYKEPMLIIVARGVGGTGDVKISPPESWITNLSIVLDVDQEKVDKRFLCQYLSQQSLKARLDTGSAQAQITINALESFVVTLPSLPIQRRISSILSAYDNLIDNNYRRIVILEEMARRIYEEWFVHFRFPGHEKVKMMESKNGLIPDGWSIKTLNHSAFITMGQSPSSEHYNTAGVGLPFHQGVTNFGTFYPSHRMYCSTDGRMARKGDVLMSVRAPVGRINLAPSDMIIGRGLCAIRSRTERQWITLHRLLEIFREEDCMGNGAIFKAVTKQEVLGIAFMEAPEELEVAFESQVSPIWVLINNLSQKNINLRSTQSLLLPKLISGELDISDLLEVEALAA